MKLERDENGKEYLVMTIREEESLARHCLDILSIPVVPFDIAYVYVTLLRDKVMNGDFTNPDIYDMLTSNGAPLWAEQILGARIVSTKGGTPKMEVSYPEYTDDGRRVIRNRKLFYPIVEPANPDFVSNVSLSDEKSGLAISPNDAIRSIWCYQLVHHQMRDEIVNLIDHRRRNYVGEKA